MKGVCVRAGNMKKINCIWNKIEMTLNCITLWTVLLDDARLYRCTLKSKVYDSVHVTCAEEYFCLFGTDSSKTRTRTMKATRGLYKVIDPVFCQSYPNICPWVLNKWYQKTHIFNNLPTPRWCFSHGFRITIFFARVKNLLMSISIMCDFEALATAVTAQRDLCSFYYQRFLPSLKFLFFFFLNKLSS